MKVEPEKLNRLANNLVDQGKGILAADESAGTAGERLKEIGLDNTIENRRLYRQLFFSTPGIEQYLGGVILTEETLNQRTDDGVPLIKTLTSRGIIPGIKVDLGTVLLPNLEGERMTQGLDGLAERLKKFKKAGVYFTKWRAVITVSPARPTEPALKANALDLARFAAWSQEAGLVPIVEPEVLMEGKQTLAEAAIALGKTLTAVFEALAEWRVGLDGMLLKSSMVVPGNQSGEAMVAKQVAEATIRVLRETVPKQVPGIAFLSGGQTTDQAINNMAAIWRLGPQPWVLTYSFARALQRPALAVWRGKADKVAAAQTAFRECLERLTEAHRGR